MEKIDKKITKLLKSYRMLGSVEGIGAGEEIILEVITTHSKQLCVGFAEWQKQEERNGNIEWLQGENTWAVFESAPYFHFSNIWITTSDLYEHYLKYLKEKEHGKENDNRI